MWPRVGCESECLSEPKKTPSRLCRAILGGNGSFRALRVWGTKPKCTAMVLGWEEINKINLHLKCIPLPAVCIALSFHWFYYQPFGETAIEDTEALTSIYSGLWFPVLDFMAQWIFKNVEEAGMPGWLLVSAQVRISVSWDQAPG